MLIGFSFYPLVAGSVSAEASPWGSGDGAFPIAAQAPLPEFPEKLAGYRYRYGLDFWGNPYDELGRVRVFSGSDWTEIYPAFPKTMNGCSNGKYMIRWRSLNPDVLIESATGYHGDVRVRGSVAKPATQGIMQGHNCSEPLFKFSKTKNGNKSTLADVVYEIKFWRAAP